MSTHFLTNGLKYEDIIVGQGTVAKTGNTIFLNYVGLLENGTVFDTSYRRISPFTFELGSGTVIPGFDQGVKGMKVGGKRKVTIPSKLAYGEKGTASIPPNATVIFEIDLISTIYPLKNGYLYNFENPIKDYDGNDHGLLNEPAKIVKDSYKFQGILDVNNDSKYEFIFTNKESGRWSTATVDPITGYINVNDHGQGGTTRIVGIYEDPLVANGTVEKGSVFDSSKTFFNDLKLDNLLLKTVGDYDSDGFQEVYWSKVDNTAYLRAVMHADGNIQYANYQSLQQMTDYLTSNGFTETIDIVF